MAKMAGRAPAQPVEHGVEDGDDSQLFSQLVHDLRNPLGVIAYFAETLPAAAERERPDLCERLQVNARRALQVVEEFALLADLRHGRAALDDTELDGAALLADLVAEIEAVERRAGCIRTVAVERACVRGDRAQLACAVRGILRQAVHSSASGSVEARLTDEDACAVLTLTIPLRIEPELEFIARFDDRALPVELARGVADLHGGTLSIEQRPGRATVALALPR